MPTQNEMMADAWLKKHGIGGATAQAPGDEPSSEDDWASDAERWYEQRAQGVDVAQLLRLQQAAATK